MCLETFDPLIYLPSCDSTLEQHDDDDDGVSKT
jgi:hypothetical protein